MQNQRAYDFLYRCCSFFNIDFALTHGYEGFPSLYEPFLAIEELVNRTLLFNRFTRDIGVCLASLDIIHFEIQYSSEVHQSMQCKNRAPFWPLIKSAGSQEEAPIH